MTQQRPDRLRSSCVRLLALTLAILLGGAATPLAGQVSLSSEVQSAWYPRDGGARAAAENDLRGWSSVEFRRTVGKGVNVHGDVTIHGSNRRRAVFDGEAALVWRGSRMEVAAGLLREQWGRFPNSAVDALGPFNTAFSLVGPERRLSQPTVRATSFFKGVAVDVYALGGGRRQPVPESDGRFGFGVPSRDVAPSGLMGDGALAMRVSASKLDVDWSAHVFAGRSRRPAFVPRFTARSASEIELTGVDAVYNHVVQAGGEVETTRADWRFLSEGFIRQGGVDVYGRQRTYAGLSAAAEYQRLGAFDGAYNLIPRVDIVADTRGNAADIPFASSLRAGMRVATTQRLPAQIDIAYLRDWALRGHGVIASAEKALAESPTVSLGFRLTAFSGSQARSVLDVWKDDLELYSYVRIGVSK
jgi:hypothetical protein